MSISRRVVLAVTAAAVLGVGGGVAAAAPGTATPANGELWKRTELYFGTGKPDGGVVSEADFAAFTAKDVTPRFPDGFTQLEGTGQYRLESGEIAREHSIVLVILYPFDDRDADTDLEHIRTDYKNLFDQESVLRTDSVERVSF
ncbi:DUF3574 domain-containing protein [Amycolatopsis rhabdoformis]|uniref:DUF3574 domain-containing protein n=1 Tax=Amycolatopsis rhabdoformis TaxID=1448059 RepID=A0ABZ1I460_9PSEU|nr:DUF3574 domain-containing protein [Amycolatopsis rhabdoformis]WSE29203.1 DUF3574 domain-containing protein [Amycolatopsis rhabdoformis]